MKQNKKEYQYKKKSCIISLFQDAQASYQKYTEKEKEHHPEAQKDLNQAGTKLQQSFELGLKYYLNKRYGDLYPNELPWKERSDLISYIERGRDASGKMVDILYLFNQLEKYGDPAPADSSINFEVIKRNNKYINNLYKHTGNDVVLDAYEESYTEIRKFILTYIDDNAPIQVIQSSNYLNLQEACEFWNPDGKYNLCLICHRTQLDQSYLRKLLYISWAMVIDFDINSGKDGLLKAYISEYGSQPNYFNVKSHKTLFNETSDKPYWMMINGVEDDSESLVGSYREWRQKYGINLQGAFNRYRQSFSKPLKVLILSGEAKKVSDILMALDATYVDLLKIYLLSSEVQFETIQEDYKAILTTYPLMVNQFAEGISNYSSYLGRPMEKSEYRVCSTKGTEGIKLEAYSSFEIPYIGVGEATKDPDLMERERFYQGMTKLSWYGVKHDFAIHRSIHYRKIKKSITDAVNDSPSKIVSLRHEPGAGGTTLSRMLAYELSKEIPVMVLKSYNDKITAKQVINFHRVVRMGILIVVENADINTEELRRFNNELMANAIPHVILYVNRVNSVKGSNDNDLRILSDEEFHDMLVKLDPYLDDVKRHKVSSLIKTSSERYPFFMSLCAFEEKFQGVKEYISHYLKDICKADYDNLTYLALVDKFANKQLDVNFLNHYDAVSDSLGIFQNEVNYNLVSKEDIGKNQYIKMRHPRFADEIINARITPIHDLDNELLKAENLSLLLRDFIRFSKLNIMYDLDSTIDILKNLIISRDAKTLVRERFSPVVEYMLKMLSRVHEDRSKENCIGLVYKELVRVYPEEPHFKAHLSRYYTYIEKNYVRGIEEAKGAVQLAEDQDKSDPLLYHIFGMSIRNYVVRVKFKEALQAYYYKEMESFQSLIGAIQEMLEKASELFCMVREANNRTAGYISDIEMCISVIDFGKKLYSCTTENFIQYYKDSWFMTYYDRALTLLEGLRNIQVEEDAEFSQLRLTTRCNESLSEMIYGIENTVTMWEDYLQRSDELQRPVVRRFIARAKEKEMLSEGQDRKGYVQSILSLMEENIAQEPQNGANIRIWFNALRYSNNNDSNSEILLDEALQKLDAWKKIGDNFESYYYYFILTCIKAIEGSSRAESSITILQEELKNKTAHMPNNRVIYEWLGEGRGVGRLINAYVDDNGKKKKKSVEEIEEAACYLEGRISKYSSDRSARIRAYNMDVFFNPSNQAKQSTVGDIFKKVKFILGFSYDGLRALNKSVKIIDDSDTGDQEEELIGKWVKFKVQGSDPNRYFLKVKLMDYRDTYGSVHRSYLPSDKGISDYEPGEILKGRIIDKKFVEKENRTYYQITLRNDDNDLPEWKRELKKLQ